MYKELVKLRTENSKTYETGPTTRRLIIGNIVHWKVNYADSKEPWKDIDLTLRNGLITKAPYILEVGQDDIFFIDRKTGHNVRIRPDKMSNYRVVPFPEGVKLSRTLSAGESMSQKFGIEVKGRSVKISPCAHDARGFPLEVESEIKDGRLIETIRNLKTMAKDNAQFPITIDPTLTVQPSSKDTWVQQEYPTNNQGSQTYIKATRRSGIIERSILTFDISSLPSGIINSALLDLYYWWSFELSVGLNIDSYRLTREDWVENQATWNIYKTGSSWTTGGGDYNGPQGGSDAVPAGYGWMEWDITTIVIDARNNRSDLAHILLKHTSEPTGGNTNSMAWYSREYTDDTDLCPKLTIDYTVDETGKHSIEPNFDSNDSYRLWSTWGTWATARNGASLTVQADLIPECRETISYHINRCFLNFTIPDLSANTLASAKLRMKIYTVEQNDDVVAYSNLIITKGYHNNPLVTTDWTAQTSEVTKYGEANTKTWTDQTWIDIPFNAAGLALIQAAYGSTLKLCVKCQRDNDNDPMIGPMGIRITMGTPSEPPNNPRIILTFKMGRSQVYIIP